MKFLRKPDLLFPRIRYHFSIRVVIFTWLRASSNVMLRPTDHGYPNIFHIRKLWSSSGRFKTWLIWV